MRKSAEEGFGQKYLKRAFDVAGASLALVVLAPVFALVAFLIKAGSAGPVFFRQERTGRGGKPFFIYKFRTMVKDAPEFGPDLTGAGDPRITRVGHLLRVTKLDELPNLINVVRGEMSLVGPRPDLPRFMSVLTPEQRTILRFRPGITGPTQIRYVAEEEFLSPVNIDENYVDNVFADKIASDLAYVSNWSFREDLLLISYTPVALLFKVFGRLTKLFPLQKRRRARDGTK
ncbi:MAG: sugar transferase [candidate division Zixibacteria bacterium]|nr:sugar transferase [candidate division Zixibacteria bacterium]